LQFLHDFDDFAESQGIDLGHQSRRRVGMRRIDRMIGRFLAVALVAMGLARRCDARQALSGTDLVKAELVVDHPAVDANQPFYVGVKLTIAPGWHIYWKNPGDAGVPTLVRWTLPAGYHAQELQYPVPERLDDPGGIVTYGYEGSVMLIARIVSDVPSAATASVGSALSANVSWLVCKEECVPGKVLLSLTMPASGSAVNAPLIEHWLGQMPAYTDSGHVTTVTQSLSPWPENIQSFRESDVVLTVKWAHPQRRPTQLDFFPEVGETLAVANQTAVDEDDSTTIRFHLRLLAGTKLDGVTMNSVLVYTLPSGRRRGLVVPIRLIKI
jgi:DsbC/DsbD-like thiol-disulfide interchange protein